MKGCQQWGTALLLVGLTIFNALLGLNQEGKAEASVDGKVACKATLTFAVERS